MTKVLALNVGDSGPNPSSALKLTMQLWANYYLLSTGGMGLESVVYLLCTLQWNGLLPPIFVRGGFPA